MVWPCDFEGFQGTKFNTFLLFYYDVQVCYGTVEEHVGVSWIDLVFVVELTVVIFFFVRATVLSIKTAFNLVKIHLLLCIILIQWGVIISIFVGHVVIVFGRLKYIPCLFSEYILTFMVEEPMKICVTN